MVDQIPEELKSPSMGRLLTNAELLSGPRLSPIVVVKTYDSEEFENFTHEWAAGYLKEKGIYKSVARMSGPGDKGIDIVAFQDEGKKIVDYYQCKHYATALGPKEAILEIGKLVYYTFTDDILLPRKYYFVAPRDAGPTLTSLLSGTPEKLKKRVLDDWDKTCKENIKKPNVPLDAVLRQHIVDMDFSIFEIKPILDVIAEHAQTVWAAPRFGGGLKARPDVMGAPDAIGNHEARYVEQLMEVYSDTEKTSITKVEDLNEMPRRKKHLARQRNAFYSAEALRIYARETLPPDYDEFERLKKDIHDGIANELERDHLDSVAKVDAVADQAMILPIISNLLADKIRPLDKHGICHELANDDKLQWIPKPDGN